MKKLMSVFGLLLCAVVFTSCNVYHHAKAVYPKPSWKLGAAPNEKPRVVDSLSPTFQWKPKGKWEGNYDFVIWESVLGKTNVVMIKMSGAVPGEAVYYRENLSTNSHTIENPLEPNTNYFWSVRKHGEKVGKWAYFDRITGNTDIYNCNFMFRTPDR